MRNMKCLLVEDDHSSAEFFKQILTQSQNINHEIDLVDSLSAALEEIALNSYDIIFLDLSVTDSEGLETFTRIYQAAPHIPIIIITCLDDEEFAINAIQQGAQDYLLKGQIESKTLVRTVDYAIERKRVENELKETENQKNAILDGISANVLYLDKDLNIIWLNKAALKDLNKTKEEIIGHPCHIACDVKQDICEECPVKKVVETQESEMSKITFEEGKVLDIHAEPVFTREGQLQGVVTITHDITAEHQAQETMNKLSLAIEQNPASVVITDLKGRIDYVNSRFSEITGYAFKEVVGQKMSIIKSGYTDEGLYRDLWRTILAGKEWRGEIENKKKNGELFWEHVMISPIADKEGKVTHFLSVQEDLTKRREYQSYLEIKENYDKLTGLPNEKLAKDRIAQAIVRSRRGSKRTAVLLVDINQLQVVNNTFGESIGDELLIEVSERLKGIVRGSDTVARFADDEFLIILPDPETLTHITIVSKKILDTFDKPFSLGGHDVFVSASIAITVFPDDGDNEEDLLQNIETSMSRAKEESKNTFRFFSHEMNEQAKERMKMEENFQQVLEKDELVVYYQPIVDLATNKIIGAEALLRWNNAELGMVYPDSFIPLAEDTGLILPIGNWVLNVACNQLNQWQSVYGLHFKMVVNLSSKQFVNNSIMDAISLVLKENGVSPETLELDVKESMLMDNSPRATNILNQISQMGVKLALDDFGTGYSALGNLKKVNFTTIKIDRSLISAVTTDRTSASISSAIIAMAHKFGFRVIGEGVETHDQLEFLRLNQCDFAQGYYFSMPVTVANFADIKIKK